VKKFCLILAILCLLPISMKAEEKAPLYGVMAGTVLGVNNFEHISGAIQTGFTVSVDAQKGLMFRTLYTKAHWGKVDFQSIRFAPLLSWYAGKKWEFYIIAGGEGWQAEGETGTNLFLGVGTWHRIYTGSTDDWVVPFVVDAFVDYTSDNTGTPYENVNQLTFGFQFSKPIKK